tara:strand:- start:3374 stop:3763 length:390 start_codon:yes stop_codon:yes gene_type:complete
METKRQGISAAGRPLITLDEQQINEVETLAAVLTTDQIADYFGISRKTFYNIMERDKAIFTRYKKGKAKAIGSIAGGLLNKARNGDLGAQVFFLKTQGGWKDTTAVEHTSPDGSMTPTKIERIIVDPTD